MPHCVWEWNDTEQLSIVQGFAEWTVSHHPASNKDISSIGISIDLSGRELLPSNYFSLRCLISTLGNHISSTALSAFPAHISATTGDSLISLQEVLGEMFNPEKPAQVIPSYLLLSMCLEMTSKAAPQTSQCLERVWTVCSSPDILSLPGYCIFCSFSDRVGIKCSSISCSDSDVY